MKQPKKRKRRTTHSPALNGILSKRKTEREKATTLLRKVAKSVHSKLESAREIIIKNYPKLENRISRNDLYILLDLESYLSTCTNSAEDLQKEY